MVISFARAFKDIPPLIKRHLYELEIKALFELCWLEDSPIIELIMDEASNKAILNSIGTGKPLKVKTCC